MIKGKPFVFNMMETIYNINDLEYGMLEKIIK